MSTYAVHFSDCLPGHELYRGSTEWGIEDEVRRDALRDLEPGQSVRADIFEYDEDAEQIGDFFATVVVQRDGALAEAA